MLHIHLHAFLKQEAGNEGAVTGVSIVCRTEPLGIIGASLTDAFFLPSLCRPFLSHALLSEQNLQHFKIKQARKTTDCAPGRLETR